VGTALHCACLEGYIEIVKLLLADERVDFNKKDVFGRTTLQVAFEYEDVEIAKLFLADNRVNLKIISKGDDDLVTSASTILAEHPIFGKISKSTFSKKDLVEIFHFFSANGLSVDAVKWLVKEIKNPSTSDVQSNTIITSVLSEYKDSLVTLIALDSEQPVQE
jgi:ankyrin repeat protein